MQSLVVGGVGIVVDAIVVAIIVSSIVDYRETSRWRYARQRLVATVSREVSEAILYINRRIYTIIIGSDLALYLPDDVRRLLDKNFSTTDDSEIKDIPQQIQVTIDQQSAAVNAELATFFSRLLQIVHALAEPTHASYDLPGSDTRVTCSDKETLYTTVLDPLDWCIQHPRNFGA